MLLIKLLLLHQRLEILLLISYTLYYKYINISMKNILQINSNLTLIIIFHYPPFLHLHSPHLLIYYHFLLLHPLLLLLKINLFLHPLIILPLSYLSIFNSHFSLHLYRNLYNYILMVLNARNSYSSHLSLYLINSNR
jgi:hypothetical protein